MESRAYHLLPPLLTPPPLLPSPSPVHVAASVGAVECLQVLAAHGADLEQRSMHGAQPLHEAAASGQTG